MGRVGGPVTWKPSVPKLLAGALLLGAAVSAFLASTPWLRAYQVARAPSCWPWRPRSPCS